jgi:hypothetical protein
MLIYRSFVFFLSIVETQREQPGETGAKCQHHGAATADDERAK